MWASLSLGSSGRSELIDNVSSSSFLFLPPSVDSKDHSDFVLLKKMLLNTHMQDLKDCTNDIHYENYRKKKLAE